MKHRLTSLQEAELIEEIRAQERRTSAEIRICITEKIIFRHQRYAWKLFDKHQMHRTRNRNATLIVIMPRVKRIVAIGDKGINALVAPDFWNDLVASMIHEMHGDGLFSALMKGVRRLGDTLSLHWPAEAADENELPDDILK